MIYCDILWYDIWYVIWYDIWYDMIYDMWYTICDIRYVIYDMIWYDIWYVMLWYDMIWYMIWYDMMRCGTVQYSTVQYNIILNIALQFPTVFSTVTCCTGL